MSEFLKLCVVTLGLFLFAIVFWRLAFLVAVGALMVAAFLWLLEVYLRWKQRRT
jgi:hypothetical protein